MLIRLFIVLISSFFLTQCGGDKSLREQAKADVAQQVNTTQTESTTPTQQQIGEPVPPRQSSDVFALSLGNVKGAATDTLCVPVTASGFNNLIGLQFSIRWEREQLRYVQVKNLEVPDLYKTNFGDTHNELGVVALSWIHQTLKGVTLPPNSHLFDICFQPTAPAGTKVGIRLEPRPVAFEAITVQEELMQFEANNGSITVE